MQNSIASLQIRIARRRLGQSSVIVAAFDFDGTLTYRDSLLPFLRFISRPSSFLANSIRLLPVLSRFALGNLDNQSAKEAVLRRFIAGRSDVELQRLGRDFSRQVLPRMLRAEGMDRLLWHQRREHTCVLVSASLDTYLGPWSKQAGFDLIACSRLAFDANGTATGALEGRNCRGSEKLKRLQGLIPSNSISELYAYGDSDGDRELLAAADHAFMRKFSE